MSVFKFGGSSVCNAEKIEVIKKAFINTNDATVCVISAIGKENVNDEKLTDLLINCYNSYGAECDCYIDKIRCKMQNFANSLNLSFERIIDYNNLINCLKSKTKYDYCISRGEYFTAKACSIYFGCKFVPAEELIILKGPSQIDVSATKKLIYDHFGEKIVVPGFYGIDSYGNINLFQRGGGDVTGAILSSLLKVDYYNYTDVAGVSPLWNDVYHYKSNIKQMGYSQLLKFALSGANVFAYRAIKYLVKAHITTYIKNIFKPKSFTQIDRTSDISDIFYFENIIKYYYIEKRKYISKSRFISEIFKFFMLNRIQCKRCAYIKNRLYFSTANSSQIQSLNNDLLLCNGVKLYLYGDENISKRDLVTNVALKYNYDYKITHHKNSNLESIVFYGDIEKNFLMDVTKILK